MNRLRTLALAAAPIALTLFAFLLFTGGGGGDHTVYVTVPKATGVLKGQYIRAGGSEVGLVTEVKAVDRGRAARLELAIDDAAWPLPEGSTLLVRWAGTINQYNRHIALDPGRAGGPPMVRDGGTLPASVLKTPVEYGELLGIFDAKTRPRLRSFVDNAGATLDASGPQLRRAFRAAPPAVNQADRVFRDLNASRENLRGLITSTSSVVGAVQRANPGLGSLVRGAGSTLAATAAEADNLRTSIAKAPATFANVRDTLRRADPTLAETTTLVRRLGPGVSELRRLSAPLNGVLGTVTDVGPQARAALAAAAASAPDVTRFVDRATQLLPRVKSVAAQVAPQLACITPYAPEIAAFGTDWGSALGSFDNRDKFIRANVEAFLPSLSNNRFDTSADVVKATPGLRYAFPRPPGFMAGQPYFLPHCNIGPESLDPTKDPEARPFKSISQVPDLLGVNP